ncbi:hypothetical protein [Thioalkalivibrio paradoxus]|uniref:Uncharacterized protein n=1 Tax=Thioalkalivibrio paradoxus ARh 1 TaxID=713585 RepID=W0DTF8_9GAMM|nr:hypothetical protein [Thioalkalivibrio paradoxus]AHF00151.1 hypothetical protein THITH_10545 [Thioalkalivibrio paradoxus ARh 1]
MTGAVERNDGGKAAGVSGPVPTVFHADLSDAHPGEEYWLHAVGTRHALVPHTARSLARLREQAPQLAHRQLTHYTERPVELPAGTVVRVHLKHTLKSFPDARAVHGVSHVAIHCPPPPERLAALVANGGAMHQTIDYVSTAKSLVFHHADLINKDPETTRIIHDYMDNNVQISGQFNDLAAQMRRMGPPTENSGWARLVPFTPDNPDAGYHGDKTYYFAQPTPASMDAAGAVMTSMMKATKNDPRLKVRKDPRTGQWQGKWTQQTGQSVDIATASESLQLAADIRALAGDDWNATLQNSRVVHGMKTAMEVLDRDKRKVKLTLTNEYIRYLGAYIRFYDADGNAMKVPDWNADAGIITEVINEALDIQYDDLRFIGYIGPVNNVMAIPIVADPGKLEVTLTFPPDAVSASIYGSGLGTGADHWPKTPIVGGVMTGIFNLGVPAFMLAAATAAQSYKPLYDIVDELSGNKKFVAAVVGGGVAFFGAQFGVSAAHKEMNWHAFSTLAQLLFNKAATKALLWVEAEMATEEAADEIPYAGWIMIAINIATGIAQMAETIVEVATSPWNIENRISTAITTQVTLHPDPRHGTWPQGPAGSSASYTVKMIYKDQARPARLVQHDLPAGFSDATLAASFPNNTLGGQVKFEADFYLDRWLAGKATTGWLENDESDVAQVTMYLVQYPIPLTEKSIYRHSALLTFREGRYQWQPTAEAPTATIASRNTSSTGNAISEWYGLTLSQRQGMIGFAWKAAGMGIDSCVSGQGGQLNAFQNIAIPGMSVPAAKFPQCGFEGPTQLVYDPYPPKFEMKDGQWVLGPDGKPCPDPNDVALGAYYIDPRKSDVSLDKDGGYHLRRVVLDTGTPFDTGAKLPSHGRFPFFPTSFALHPAGYVIAVTSHNRINKLQIAPLSIDGAADDALPVARTYAGEALETDRAGLLFRPVAVTCSYDGTILVLEDTRAEGQGSHVVARIQAFDLHGDPVNRFVDADGHPTPFLPLFQSGEHSYLDIAAVGNEKQTYIYVLYYTGDGAAATDYSMAVYQYGTEAPKVNPLVTTPDIPAAKLVVDLWHTVYTLNFDMTTDGSGHHAGPGNASTGPAGRTVPSVSEWIPPLPGT